MILSSKKGFGLIEVMIAVAIMTIIGLGFSQLMVTGIRGQGAVTSNSDVNNLATLVQVVLGNEPACKQSLVNMTFPTGGVTNHTLTNWTVAPLNPAVTLSKVFFTDMVTPIITSGGLYGTDYKITKLQLYILSQMATNAYTGAIHIEATRVGSMVSGSNVFQRDVQIPLIIQTVTAGAFQKIQDCPTAPPPTCAAPNWAPVGTGAEGFCINTTATFQPAQGIFVAATTCASQNSHLCSSEEWMEACNFGGPGFDSATPQWVAPIYTGIGTPGNYMLAGGGCLLNIGGAAHGSSRAYRCCHR